MQYSLKAEKGQADSSKTEPYASRLREERIRVQPHQGKFAEKIGISQNRQSFLENGTRELRADYLEVISAHGIDILYVLTGERNGFLLGAPESEMVGIFTQLRPSAKAALLSLMDELLNSGRDRSDNDPPALSPTLHSTQKNYQAPEDD